MIHSFTVRCINFVRSAVRSSLRNASRKVSLLNHRSSPLLAINFINILDSFHLSDGTLLSRIRVRAVFALIFYFGVPKDGVVSAPHSLDNNFLKMATTRFSRLLRYVAQVAPSRDVLRTLTRAYAATVLPKATTGLDSLITRVTDKNYVGVDSISNATSLASLIKVCIYISPKYLCI